MCLGGRKRSAKRAVTLTPGTQLVTIYLSYDLFAGRANYLTWSAYAGELPFPPPAFFPSRGSPVTELLA